MDNVRESTVIKDISLALSSLESAGDILWWSRMQSGKVKTEWGSWVQLCQKGTPDFIAIFQDSKSKIRLLFIEAKRPGVREYRPAQLDFMRKYSKHQDIHFILVNSASEVKHFILEHCFNRVMAMEL